MYGAPPMLGIAPRTTICGSPRKTAYAANNTAVGHQHGRLEPRATGLVDGEGGLLLGDTRLDLRDPRRIEPQPGREDVTEDDLVHLLRLELGALDRLTYGNGPELGCGLLGQRSTEGADGGTRRAHEDRKSTRLN